MLPMPVTLEVSKLSGWLNADASCRESEGGQTVWGEVQSTGRREVAGVRGARSVQGRARVQIGSRARGGAHRENAGHGCDAGGVEAQRLVEGRRVLPRVERRAFGTGRGAEYREARGGGRPRRKRRAGEGSSADWEQGTRGAHPEHVVHGRDLGRVEAQRLVEGRRVLPSRNEGTRCERGAGREATGRREAQRATARQAVRRARFG